MISTEVDNNDGQQEEIGGNAETKVSREPTDSGVSNEEPSGSTDEAPAIKDREITSDEQESCADTANQGDELPNTILPPDLIESAIVMIHQSNEVQAQDVPLLQNEAADSVKAAETPPDDNVPELPQLKKTESEKVEPNDSESIEATIPQRDEYPAYSEPQTAALPVDSVDQTEADNTHQTFSETPQQDESTPPYNAGGEDENEEELTPQQSSESIPTKPTGFMESLTANFAPDTKAMWAQIFGPRYDEGDEEDTPQAYNQSSAISPKDSVSSKSSLQAKLDRERKLDEQIQASRQRYRDRVLRDAAANNISTRRGRTKASQKHKTQPQIMAPFELAGLSLTQVRFCSEKALNETCKCFRQLHAAALSEAEAVYPPGQGILVTQLELEHLLRELFDPQDTAATTRKGTLAAPLGFAQIGSIAAGVSMTTQLQASWFIPFGQLPQLRSLIMKITKRHLNEDKLAIVNRHLQKQLTLLPLSSKLQSLVVQLSNHHLLEPFDVPIRQKLRSPEELAEGLLGCIAVQETLTATEAHDDYKNFLLFLPVELMAKTHLSSLICAQRLIFFRFLVEIVAAERSRLHSKSLPSSLPDPVPAKRKSIAGKRSRRSSKVISAENEANPEKTIHNSKNPAETGSVEAARGSLPSASEAGTNEISTESDPLQEASTADQIGDECEKPASQLQQQLESAIAQLRQTLPGIDSNTTIDARLFTLNPAIRATYLAAVACHESVILMLGNNIDVDTIMPEKLRHFIDALQAIQAQTAEQLSQSQDESMQLQHDAPRFPPPYPESTVPDESDVQSEKSSAPTNFPPPYAITTPSYWTFSPSIPEPKSSIAKLASKSPSNKSADLRSHFMSREAPGVGAYDIQQGDNLTYQQQPSYSFGLTGDEKPHGGRTPSKVASNTSASEETIGKPKVRSTLRQRMKSSLAFVPPILRPSEDNQPSIVSRVYKSSQYDDKDLRMSLEDLPPQYSEGDENEAPEELPEEKPSSDQAVETEMDRALRLQQRYFMNEFVQQVVSNQETPSLFVRRTNPTTDKRRRPVTKSEPYWASSEVSPGIERLLHRQRRAPSSSKFQAPNVSNSNPRSQSSKRVVKKPPPSPPRRQLDNDQHLAWAARISELYQPTVLTPEQ